MPRFVTILLLSAVFSVTAKASHITGGEMYYTFIGINNGQYQYNVTLKLFQRCNSGRQFQNPCFISVFDKVNNTRVTDISVNISRQENIRITNPDPCITNPPIVCYDVAYYNFTVSLPASAAGYVMASQVNYRIAGINNLSPGYSNVGATYTAEIPGNATGSAVPENNSASFTGSDLVIVCANNDFTYSFAAQDVDGDELRYSFCDAYQSTSPGGGQAIPTNPPPFPPVGYNTPAFDGSSPLGNNININPTTGLISGIAPAAGTYVVTVCVQELKGGVVVATQRKDLQISIADCNIASASLLPEYLLCKNTQTITIANQSISPLIVTSDWELLDNANNVIHTATGSSVTYTFPAIGVYTVKLVINRNQPCTDSVTSTIRVFPGFVPDFNSAGICITKPSLFFDATTSVHGTPNFWKWDFGEPGSANNISSIKNPTYTYPSLGPKTITLMVGDTRGCKDTITKAITIIDKPPLTLAFKDTLICKNDNLQLQASGNGIFSWGPAINIVNPTTATPTVSPIITTTYIVNLNDNGCLNKDSVKVRVVDFVSLQSMADTTICRNDTIQLRLVSDALQYIWTPASQIINPTIQNPFVITNNALTDYKVTAIIGGCSATENIIVRTVPYPIANAGKDFGICYNTSGQLNGITDGSSWRWSPAGLVTNPVLLNPVTYPPRTTDFILTVFDTKGCPKPGRDTVRVTVYPKMNVSAGRDTAVIIGQPLQLNATGGVTYRWSPPDNLSATNIQNPVALFPTLTESIRYKVIGFSSEGCQDSAYINVKIFKTLPTIFVPTAFTPNNDGKNDFLLPIGVGIKNIDYFNVYNRWGQLLFSTRTNGHGWDGKIKGIPQTTSTFIWTVKATDYTGAAYFQKGISTLIR
jgi:gliding motility-associated-like protein